MKAKHISPVAIALLALGAQASPGQAEPAYGAYGGGFIEFLATGRSGPTQAVLYNAPGQAPVGRRPVTGPIPTPAYARAPQPDYGPPPTQAYAREPAVVEPYPRPSAQMRSAPAAAYTAVSYAPAQPADRTPTLSRAFNPAFARTEVDYDGPQRAGTIVIDTPSRYLYLVQPGRRAIRYGIGVGRPGFEWSGVKTITRKAEWPDWRPPSEMLRRRPDLPAFMEGGPSNPLGARALYLGSSLYRIHGTNEPETIGRNVSSGCIRMMNEDVIDLYGRVGVGARVIVM